VHQFGLPAYEWYTIQYAAAAGDYKLAFETIESALEYVRARPDSKKAWAWSGLKATKDLPAEQQAAAKAMWKRLAGTEVHGARAFDDPLEAAKGVIRDQHLADLYALKAWLKLEAGEVKDARKAAKLADAYSLALAEARGAYDLAHLVLYLTDPRRRPKSSD
jgi:hypothetical protein